MTAPKGLALEIEVDESAPVVYCRSCGAEIWWGKTPKGNVNPFDVTGGQRTNITHFSTCPDASRWSKR